MYKKYLLGITYDTYFHVVLRIEQYDEQRHKAEKYADQGDGDARNYRMVIDLEHISG